MYNILRSSHQYSACFPLDHPLYCGSPCSKIGTTASQAKNSEVKSHVFDCPLYLHWFGMKLYDLFHKDIGNGENIEIEIGNFCGSIPKQSLEHMVTAYQTVTATATVSGGMDSEERSLIMTAQIATDLNDFLFLQHDIGKVLHQMPVVGRSERPDWLAVPVHNYVAVVPKSTLVCDFKLADLNGSKTETFAYCSRVIGKNSYRIFMALCATCFKLEVYLILSFNQKMGDAKICKVHVNDASQMKQLFCMLYGAVQYLTRHPIATEWPSCSPTQSLIFNAENLLSASTRYRVFHQGGFVYKLYDASSTSKPNVGILQKVEYFEQLDLFELNCTGRFKCLRYKYLDGTHEGGNKQHFIRIAQILLELHEEDYVHGDVREANIIFGSNTAWIIDFDICDEVNALYPNDYNHMGIQERHPDACANREMKKIHDVYSLTVIIAKVLKYKDLVDIISQLQ